MGYTQFQKTKIGDGKLLLSMGHMGLVQMGRGIPNTTQFHKPQTWKLCILLLYCLIIHMIIPLLSHILLGFCKFYINIIHHNTTN